MKYVLFAAMALLAIAIVVHIYNKDVFGPNKANLSPLVIAHRGASGHAPENTLAAVRKGLAQQADLIEVDLHLSADGEVVVIHDATLERTTDGQGAVSEHSLAALQGLDAGSWFDTAFAGEGIPTLQEVMQAVDGQATLLLEIKWGADGSLYEGIEEKVIAQVDSFQAQKWVIVQSFRTEVIRRIHELAPDLPVHKLIIGNLPMLPIHHDGHFQLSSAFAYPYVQAINPSHQLLTQKFVNVAHQKGFQVFSYTVNKPEEMHRLMKLGVDGIITNYPDRLRSVIEAQGG